VVICLIWRSFGDYGTVLTCQYMRKLHDLLVFQISKKKNFTIPWYKKTRLSKFRLNRNLVKRKNGFFAKPIFIFLGPYLIKNSPPIKGKFFLTETRIFLTGGTTWKFDWCVFGASGDSHTARPIPGMGGLVYLVWLTWLVWWLPVPATRTHYPFAVGLAGYPYPKR
jgi:hypothetical protein